MVIHSCQLSCSILPEFMYHPHWVCERIRMSVSSTEKVKEIFHQRPYDMANAWISRPSSGETMRDYRWTHARGTTWRSRSIPREGSMVNKIRMIPNVKAITSARSRLSWIALRLLPIQQAQLARRWWTEEHQLQCSLLSPLNRSRCPRCGGHVACDAETSGLSAALFWLLLLQQRSSAGQ